MHQSQLREIYDRTGGHCHFCGDRVIFSRRGWAADLRGYWEVDHVIQRAKGGSRSATNCLPACTRCNRLRWHRSGRQVRELLLLGLIARDEIRRSTEVGRRLRRLRRERIARSVSRRRPRSGQPA